MCSVREGYRNRRIITMGYLMGDRGQDDMWLGSLAVSGAVIVRFGMFSGVILAEDDRFCFSIFLTIGN
jgi:hypothetical protein